MFLSKRADDIMTYLPAGTFFFVLSFLCPLRGYLSLSTSLVSLLTTGIGGRGTPGSGSK